MKRILFAVLPEKGHINPYIGPAQALIERGNEVWFVAPGDISAQITRAGLRFDRAWLKKSEPALPMSGEAFVSLVKNREEMRNWVTALILDVRAAEIELARSYFLSERVTLAVIDPLYSAAVIAAELAGVKWVSMSNSLNPAISSEIQSDLLETVSLLNEKRERLFAEYGIRLEFSGCDAISKDLTIAFATEEFVGRPALKVELVGPSLPLNSRGDEADEDIAKDDRPLIYASFGSQLYHWPELFEKLVEACEGLDVRLALATGELAAELRTRKWPEFVQIFAYAPQLEILRLARVFITHGGANSIMEAIHANTPVLISPMCNDQFHQAFFVERSGVGLVRDLQQSTAAEIKNALTALLEDRKIKDNMSRVSQSYQRDGARESARLIEQIL